MTKLRAPESIEDACHQAIALLGESAISLAAGVTASLVRKWADPDDHAHRIGLHQALAIDRTLLKLGHAAVFAALFEPLQLAEVEAAAAGEEVDPLRLAVRITSDAALLMNSVDGALADKTMTPLELIRIRAETGRLQKSIARLRRGLWIKAPSRVSKGRA